MLLKLAVLVLRIPFLILGVNLRLQYRTAIKLTLQNIRLHHKEAIKMKKGLYSIIFMLCFNSAFAAKWVEPFVLPQGTIYPKAVLDQGGNSTIIWASIPQRSIFALNSQLNAQPISLTMNDDFVDPALSIDKKGNRLVLWVDKGNGNQCSVRAAYFNVTNNQWDIYPNSLGTVWHNTVSRLHVASDDHGNAVAAWQVGDSMVESARFDPSGVWTRIQDIHLPSKIESSSATSDDFEIKFSMGNGLAALAWSDVNHQVYVTTLQPTATTWIKPFKISSYKATADFPAVAVNKDNTALLVWQESGKLTAQLLPFKNTHWQPLPALNYETTDTSMDVIAAPNGDFQLIWVDHNPVTLSLQTNNNTWTAPHSFLSNSEAKNPLLTFDKKGDALAIWSDTSYVYASLKLQGKNWQPEKAFYANLYPHYDAPALTSDGAALISFFGTDSSNHYVSEIVIGSELFN